MIEGVFINLERAAERRASMEKQLGETPPPYPVRRLAAIDGTRRADPPQGLTPGQYGCWLSHLEAMRQAADNGEHLHVMEDDALLSEHLAALPEMLEALEAGSDGNWDLLFLDATLVEVPDMVLMFEWTQLAREQGRIHLHAVPPHFTLYGTHSYVVNSRRKHHVLDFLDTHLRSGKPIDHVLAYGIRQGRLAAHLTTPFITSSQDLGLSRTIGEGDDRFLAWFIYRRLCFATPGEDTLAMLEERLATLMRSAGRQERMLGELLAYRIARWPRLSFRPEMP